MNPANYRVLSRLGCVVVLVSIIGFKVVGGVESLPSQLSDEQFWKLSTDLSEPDGTFRSDNLLSNEIGFQYVIPELTTVSLPGRAYLGVGPEQNFTYIAALKPKIAFIIDIRRGNLDLHLMYKAIFELSGDRREFISRLFSRPKPDGLPEAATIKEVFEAFSRNNSSEDLYAKNLKEILDLLQNNHHFELSEGDVSGVEYAYRNFYRFGPAITYSSSSGGGGFGRNSFVTYSTLMAADDGNGVARSYLANEETFGFLKELESRNMVVPVVGNFVGPKAIRAVGKYLKENDTRVSAFYLSNVEQYLVGTWGTFCENVATLPLDGASTFIRSVRGGDFGLDSRLGHMVAEVNGCDVR